MADAMGFFNPGGSYDEQQYRNWLRAGGIMQYMGPSGIAGGYSQPVARPPGNAPDAFRTAGDINAFNREQRNIALPGYSANEAIAMRQAGDLMSGRLVGDEPLRKAAEWAVGAGGMTGSQAAGYQGLRLTNAEMLKQLAAGSDLMSQSVGRQLPLYDASNMMITPIQAAQLNQQSAIANAQLAQGSADRAAGNYRANLAAQASMYNNQLRNPQYSDSATAAAIQAVLGQNQNYVAPGTSSGGGYVSQPAYYYAPPPSPIRDEGEDLLRDLERIYPGIGS